MWAFWSFYLSKKLKVQKRQSKDVLTTGTISIVYHIRKYNIHKYIHIKTHTCIYTYACV